MRLFCGTALTTLLGLQFGLQSPDVPLRKPELPGRLDDAANVGWIWEARNHGRGNVAERGMPGPSSSLREHWMGQVGFTQDLPGVCVEPAKLGVCGFSQNPVDALLLGRDQVRPRCDADVVAV